MCTGCNDAATEQQQQGKQDGSAAQVGRQMR